MREGYVTDKETSVLYILHKGKRKQVCSTNTTHTAVQAIKTAQEQIILNIAHYPILVVVFISLIKYISSVTLIITIKCFKKGAKYTLITKLLLNCNEN